MNFLTYYSLENPKKVFNLLIILMMIGNVYTFPFFRSLSWGEVILLLFFPYFILNIGSLKIVRIGSILAFVLYALLSTLLFAAVSFGDVQAPLVRILREAFYYVLIFYCGYYLFDYAKFSQGVIIFCKVLSLYIVLQSFVYSVTGWYIPGFFMNAALNDGGYSGSELYNHFLTYAKISGYLRPNGFLCEPAQCAQCLFLGILVSFFSPIKGKKQLITSVWLTVGLVCTMSTSAIVYAGFSWIVWLIKEGKRNITHVLFIIAIVSLGVILIYGKTKYNNLLAVIEKLTNSFSKDTISNSSELRLFKGFLTFASLPFFYKIFGIGFGNYDAAVPKLFSGQNIHMVESEYMNSFSYILVSAGVIGACLLFVYFIQRFRRSCFLGKICVIALVLIASGSSIYSTPICVWFMLIIEYNGNAIENSPVASRRGNG